MPPALLASIATSAASAADLFIVEAAMGLFDGIAAAPGQTGAPADIAAAFALPVILVLDVSGQSQSAAAVARGFATHDPRVRIAGVILNRVASPRHRDGVAEAMTAAGIPVLGCIFRDPALTLPERHLGLVQAGEHAALGAYLDTIATTAERSLDLDAITEAAAPFHPSLAAANPLPPPGQRIALAMDAAFSFIYPHLLQGWRGQGAEIIPFSPLANEPPPADCDAAWLPGGYPELHAATLATAKSFTTGLQSFAETRPVHGECGGYMVLGETLTDADGHTHAMTGLLSHATSFARRKLHLGYRQATLLAATPLGPAGASFRGHEYHHTTLTHPGTDAPLAALRDGTGRDLGQAGGRRGHVTGSYFHVIAEAPPP
jgi:cobyrinic acid a,c-diamide synthase